MYMFTEYVMSGTVLYIFVLNLHFGEFEVFCNRL